MTGQTTHPNDTDQRTIHLTQTELGLVLTSLRFLLAAEDDAAEIARLKRLIVRLEAR